MPYENFLINPPKRIKSKRFRRLRRNFLGEELMVIGNSPKRRKKTTKVRRRKRPATTILSSLRGLKKRFFSNSRKKKGGVKSMARKRKRSRRRNPVAANAPRKRKRSRRRNPVAANAPRRRRRRSYRRNPVAAIGSVNLMKPQTLIPYFITGAASMIATAKVPTMIGADSMLWKYGSQALTAIGGGWAIGKFVGKNYGFVWAIAGGSVIMSDIISNYILKQAGISGIGEDIIETSPEAMGSYPYSEIGYHPEMEGYPYSEVGAFPYEYV